MELRTANCAVGFGGQKSHRTLRLCLLRAYLTLTNPHYHRHGQNSIHTPSNMNTLLLPTLLLATTASAITHMNPTMKYVVSNPAPRHEGASQSFASSSYFEVDSPTLSMQYSEVGGGRSGGGRDGVCVGGGERVGVGGEWVWGGVCYGCGWYPCCWSCCVPSLAVSPLLRLHHTHAHYSK